MDEPDGFCFAPEVTRDIIADGLEESYRELGLDPDTGEPIATPFGEV